MLRGIGWQPRNVPEERRIASHDGVSLQRHARKHVASNSVVITEGRIWRDAAGSGRGPLYTSSRNFSGRTDKNHEEPQVNRCRVRKLALTEYESKALPFDPTCSVGAVVALSICVIQQLYWSMRQWNTYCSNTKEEINEEFRRLSK